MTSVKNAIENDNAISTVDDNPHVYYFSGPNYSGRSEGWNGGPALIDHLDGRHSGGYNKMNKDISSMIVLHGQCQTCTSVGEDFRTAPESTMSYYNANGGINNQGAYPTLGDDDNKITCLRTQRDDIYRGTSKPYLVIRDGVGTTDENAKAITLQEDNPSIDAFSAEMLFCIGSPSGYWYLYDEPNYQGNLLMLKTDGGTYNQGVYFMDTPFTVRSATTTLNNDKGSWTYYNPANLNTYTIQSNLPITVTLDVRYFNDDHATHYLKQGESFTFDVDEDRSILISGNNQEVTTISLNADSYGHDLQITHDQDRIQYYTSGDIEQFDVLSFSSNYYLSYWNDPIGVANNGPMKLTHSMSSNGLTLTLDKV
ncbi:hypothetical protein [Klebsiella aerogenes]|uniref:hypothetical protein n=1 Tax=Klebsiella aerogenes TaxID=548 RepID=UPI0013A5F638|nr:hypothetical protein [Klebsiella aerogenes]HCB2860302.1 hypothetical protein [Klebsiella aerogenes]HCB2865476.1 hypothetical protein [Klebsiella aerogenes]HCB2881643.1 hypothetical protein [Klebsiella aerogenes]HCB3346300.1 hypothetical protein [Klebsiella aerogenes]HCM1812370.1 hypothetical protein [Klebsiella aerogenes]